MQKERFRFRKGDLIAVAAVLLAAVLVALAFWPGRKGAAAYAEIYQGGKLLFTVSLAQDREFPVEGDYRNTVTVRDGKSAITQSDCPGGDCVRCGWADRSGKSIVCLPNALEIRVVSSDSDVDFVVG